MSTKQTTPSSTEGLSSLLELLLSDTQNNNNNNNNNNNSTKNDIIQTIQTNLQNLNHHNNKSNDDYYSSIRYLDCDGPIQNYNYNNYNNSNNNNNHIYESSLIRYDAPFAPFNHKKSLQLRKKLNLPNATEILNQTQNNNNNNKTQNNNNNNNFISTDEKNIRAILDSFIPPRRWVEREYINTTSDIVDTINQKHNTVENSEKNKNNYIDTVWVQHASPFPSSRTEALETHELFKKKLQLFKAKKIGVCYIRTVLVAECFMEVIRQLVTEQWERGLLFLYIYTDLVATHSAHRLKFETRAGHALRLSLLGEKETNRVQENIKALSEKIKTLQQEEETLKEKCADFMSYAEEQTLIMEKQHNDNILKLKKEGIIKRNQLEKMVELPSSV